MPSDTSCVIIFDLCVNRFEEHRFLTVCLAMTSRVVVLQTAFSACGLLIDARNVHNKPPSCDAVAPQWNGSQPLPLAVTTSTTVLASDVSGEEEGDHATMLLGTSLLAIQTKPVCVSE